MGCKDVRMDDLDGVGEKERIKEQTRDRLRTGVLGYLARDWNILYGKHQTPVEMAGDASLTVHLSYS
jgi:hypothetical protein